MGYKWGTKHRSSLKHIQHIQELWKLCWHPTTFNDLQWPLMTSDLQNSNRSISSSVSGFQKTYHLVGVKIFNFWPLMTSHDLKWPFSPKIKMNPWRTFSQLSKNISFGGGQNFPFLTFNDLSRPQMTFFTQNQNESLEDFFSAFQKHIIWWGSKFSFLSAPST